MEVLIRSELHKKGLRFKKNDPKLPGKPDIVFVKQRVVIFLDGDFWHGYRFPSWKGRLSKFWQNKIDTNRKRDQKNFTKLRWQGWRVARIWEHEVKKDKNKVVNKILEILKK